MVLLALSIAGRYYYNYTRTPKIYPTNADKPIAMVPQIVMRRMAFGILEPPVFAAMAPNITRNTMVNP